MTDWSPATWWWLVAGLLVAAELLSGSFYLLMLALGAVAAAVAAQLGLGLNPQLVVAALAGGASVAVLYAWRRQHPGKRGDEDRSQHLDLGWPVQVTHWAPDGTTRVQHRGSAWTARYAGPEPAAPGRHIIRAVHANQLVLERAPAG